MTRRAGEVSERRRLEELKLFAGVERATRSQQLSAANMPERKRSNENHYYNQIACRRPEAGAGPPPTASATRPRRPRSLSLSATSRAAVLGRDGVDSAANVIMQQPARETIQSRAAQPSDTKKSSLRAPEDVTESHRRAGERRTQVALNASARWTPCASERRGLVPVALVCLYCLLTACAPVARCAPTGIQRVKTGGVSEGRRNTPASDDDLIGVVDAKPIGILLTTSPQDRYQAKPTGSEQSGGQQRRAREQGEEEEANISSKSPLESSLLLARDEQSSRDSQVALDGDGGGGSHDEDERQIMLVLASDTAPSPSSLRRLSKRSGISDQRLAEIQMIRALKKQLERAATKIATEGEDGGQTATTGAEAAGA